MSNEIKVGICVAYDWELLQFSIPLIYNNSSKICLSIDKDRISWSGKKFSWDQDGFDRLIKRIDPNSKIEIYEDDFHIEDLNPMENEVRQRTLTAQFLGDDGWHIQIDADEYFIDYEGFLKTLLNISDRKAVSCNVICPVINMYRNNEHGTFYIDYDDDTYVYHNIATKNPVYEYGRVNGKFNIHTNHMILHQSWARGESEILEKLTNWGHSHDIEIDQSFNRWQSINKENYQNSKNFHPVEPTLWPKLSYVNKVDINELISYFRDNTVFQLSAWKMRKRNSKNLSRVKKLLRLLS